jgi:hypothetical protein
MTLRPTPGMKTEWTIRIVPPDKPGNRHEIDLPAVTSAVMELLTALGWETSHEETSGLSREGWLNRWEKLDEVRIHSRNRGRRAGRRQSC